MKDLLKSKVLLISGGTQGLGAGIARAAAREGATLVLAGRNTQRGEAVADQLRGSGVEVSVVRADIGDVPEAQGRKVSRYSALAHPKTTSASPRLGSMES